MKHVLFCIDKLCWSSKLTTWRHLSFTLEPLLVPGRLGDLKPGQCACVIRYQDAETPPYRLCRGPRANHPSVPWWQRLRRCGPPVERKEDDRLVHRGKVDAYSPFLNPIENCFSVYKADLKQRLGQVQSIRWTIAARLWRQDTAASERGGAPSWRSWRIKRWLPSPRRRWQLVINTPARSSAPVWPERTPGPSDRTGAATTGGGGVVGYVHWLCCLCSLLLQCHVMFFMWHGHWPYTNESLFIMLLFYQRHFKLMNHYCGLNWFVNCLYLFVLKCWSTHT